MLWQIFLAGDVSSRKILGISCHDLYIVMQAYMSRTGGDGETGMEDVLMLIQAREAFTFVQPPPQSVSIPPPWPRGLAGCDK